MLHSRDWLKIGKALLATLSLFLYFAYLSALLRKPVDARIQQLHQFGVLLAGSLGVFLAAASYVWSCRWRPERFFLMLFVPISLAMMVLMPIGRVPDEEAHLARAYLVSRGHIFGSALHHAPQPSNLFPRNVSGQHITLHVLFKGRCEALEQDTGNPVPAWENTGIYPVNNYFPQALGIAVVKGFTNNRLAVLYGARFGGWLFVLALLYHAIRMSPWGKWVLCNLSLLPMMLQESISASADGMAVAVAAVFVAFVLKYRHSPLRFGAVQYAAMFMLTFLVVTVKVFYCFLAPLLLTLPVACFGNRKRKAIAEMAVFGSILSMACLWIWLHIAVYASDADSRMATCVLPQLAAMAASPVKFPAILYHTCIEHWQFYLETLFGAWLSWFNLSVPRKFAWMWLALFAATLYRDRRCSPMPSPVRFQLLMAGLSLLSAIALFLGLYVWWTSPEDSFIKGIQGRYFIPLLFPLALSVPCRKAEPADHPRPDLGLELAAMALLDCAVLATLLHQIAI